MPEINYAAWLAVLLLIFDWVVRVGLSVRVIMRRRPVGVSLSWLGLILVLPVMGAAFYLFLGETRIGKVRRRRFERIRESLTSHLTRLAQSSRVNLDKLSEGESSLARLGQSMYGFPVLGGNALALLEDSDRVFDRLIEDIDAATSTIHMLFYIWWDGGRVTEVVAALLRARKRGVTIRLACDVQGSKAFLKGNLVRELRGQGVEIVSVLPMSLWRTLFRRPDLRNHRKIVVIDGAIGYCGSMNMADPGVFKKDAGVGQWVDAMVRLTGPAVEALGLVFLTDWDVETPIEFGDFYDEGDLHTVPETGLSKVQILPSGPGYFPHAIRETMVTAIYAAKQELVLTTPYFVPDETLLTALCSAAHRGVAVTLIVPKHVDSLMVRLASQSQYIDLLEAGVVVQQFAGGLLHTKSLTVDRQTALLGTVNLDMRSMWLNFEITLALFDPGFAQQVAQLQQQYMDASQPITYEAWSARPFHQRMIENIFRLLGPLL